MGHLVIHESPDQEFPPECECGDRFLIGVTVVPCKDTVALQTGPFKPKTQIDWSIIEAIEDGWADANGHSWGDWLPSDVTFWAKLPRKPRGLEVCEHGVKEGDWCETCHREYRQAAEEYEAAQRECA